ncbi:NrfJ [Nitrosomonas communis]|uniref:NrfJ n=1 Tax=Nitrosomonas communis TaxID=44574 RepID=UPI0026EA702E|nr:NrfJ [Nitrosomonas communis]
MKKLLLIMTAAFLLGPIPAFSEQPDKNAANVSSAPADKLPADEGIVVSVLDTTGYTYMELENGGKRFWIAAPTTKVNIGDHIRFVENMSMHNFTSKTLNRTFDKLIFVTSTKVKVAQ